MYAVLYIYICVCVCVQVQAKFNAIHNNSRETAEVNDMMIIHWANKEVRSSGDSSPASNHCNMHSFRDRSLSNSLFFLNLLYAVEPSVVNWDLVHLEELGANILSTKDRTLNARYAISVARKLGATIFLLPEDIVEVNPKMIMTFVACILGCSLSRVSQI